MEQAIDERDDERYKEKAALRQASYTRKKAAATQEKGPIPTGEAALVYKLQLPIEMYTMGDGFTWNTQNRAQDIATARHAWQQAVTLLRDPSFDMVILDELNIVLRYDYLPLAEVLEELRNKRHMLHVVITGRNAKEALLDLADLVTEM